MRYDAQSRIISLSFKREPKEHAEIMLEAGRRLAKPRGSSYGWMVLVKALAAGAVIGIGMEVYRSFVLSPLLGIDDVTPLNIVVLQLAPLLVLLVVLLYLSMRSTNRRRRQALIDRLDLDIFIDTDVYRDGIRSSSGPIQISMDWNMIRNILLNKTRIEFEGDSFVTYIPERAFENRAAFEAASAQFHELWLEARQKQMPTAADAAAPMSG